jgi:hypothetical protein
MLVIKDIGTQKVRNDNDGHYRGHLAIDSQGILCGGRD